MSKQILPIDSFLPEIVDAVKVHSNVILVAEPGAGKTTRVPAALVSGNSSKWIVLQPRRWAAKLTANRIAEENQWQLGNEVGYQIRFETKVSKNTRITLMTEGVLLRKLIQDPELGEYAGVILDEFHERSLDLDLSLALLKEIQDSLRPELKIVVMSATLDPAPLERFFGVSKTFVIPGRTFPVTKRYLPVPDRRDLDLIPALKIAIAESKGGDILIFLPGSGEIERACEEIRAYLGHKTFQVLPLYAALSEDKQRKVFEVSREPKIICSTNIAETSLTLPNVKVVIDSGQTKVMRMDPQLGLDRLETLRISRASSDQRAGRAGRVSEGVCIRLWHEAEQAALRHFETPEIHRVNLSRALLLLSEFGVSNFETFVWFEKPKSSMLNHALEELESLHFFKHGKMTELGKKALRLPLEPRLAAIVLSAEKHGYPEFGARFAAFLENLSYRESIRDEDRLLARLNQLTNTEQRSAEQMIEGRELPRLHEKNWPVYEKILIESGRSRIMIRGKMVGRRNVKAKEGTLPDRALLLSVMEKNEIIASSWVPLSAESLQPYLQKKRDVFWDEDLKRVRGQEGVFFEDLAFGNLTDVAATKEEASHALQAIVLKDPEGVLSKNLDFENFLKRVAFYRQSKEFSIPWSDLIQSLVMGKTRLSEVVDAPIMPLLEGLISPSTLAGLDEWAPERLEMPTGSKIKIDYDSSPPKLSVRLQEVFGWLDTPKIAQGRVPILLELLSPGYKPMQLTKDLRSFWSGTYFEIKKELKARYPKHAWPEDPLTAKPVAKGRPRNF